MTLHLHRAERSDRLVGALAALLEDPLPDPFQAEIVCVPTRGVERWLSQELSSRLGAQTGGNDGVCVGVDFPSPRRLVSSLLAASLGDDADDADPWRPEHAVWPLLRVIDGSRGEEWAQLLWASFGPDDRSPSARRWSTARHLADLYAGYAATRPEMIGAWRRRLDVDASGHPLPSDRAWQAELWRRLRTAVDRPSPAERTAAAISRLRSGVGLAALPERVSVFGATRLDPDHLQILAVVAEQREVHLWLPHPSPVLWRGLAELRPARRRAEDRTEAAVRHRLLAYLGRDARELQHSLALLPLTPLDHHYAAPDIGATSLLGHLQADLTADRQRPPEDRALLDPLDRSISLHASHGPDRQVEVLREVLVGLLADDPTLEPRDVIVMCPDIETYAPLIAATFGLGRHERDGDQSEPEAEHPGHRLRVRLADRSLRQLNPLLAIVASLVGLAESRMTASALLDLCSTAPVARRFGFRSDDLDRLRELVLDAGVRWGLDAAHREQFGMGDFRQNTWSAGLDRLLLGVTMDETDQHFIGTTLPMDDVDSADVDLVGRLVECVHRIETVTDACRVRQGVESWIALFKQALELLTSVPTADSWQLGHAYAELARIADAADQPSGEVELSLAEVSVLLAEAFRGRPTRANFRTGTLTMCTMVPMRSVPHRVVCLLGVDDGVFPRPARLDGDDIRTADEWVGDRSERSEDRQLLLDAIMAAEDRLVVIYTGRDPRSGKATPPAVPISELVASLETTARTVDGRTVEDAISTVHPLQPFDARNFSRSDQPTGQPFSFDHAALRGVRAAAGQRLDPSGEAGGGVVLPPLKDWVPTLADLIRFYGHPLRALLKDRANLSSWRDDELPDEQLPAGLNGLERWQIGERLLQQRLRGRSIDSLAAAEWRRGTLPPRMIGQQVIDRILQNVTELADAATPYLAGTPQRYEVLVELDGTRLTGAVPRVYGADLVRVTFSRLSAKHRLQSWIELLALAATQPDTAWRAVTIGGGGTSILGPVPADSALIGLADLVGLQRIGLSEPLPFAPKTSAEYARHRRLERPIASYRGLVAKVWGQERDALYEQFFGDGVSVEDLLALPPRPDEVSWGREDTSRFGVLAQRVFHPMLSREDLT
jgi:exodeoxyribonuclease V gamma subunit